MTVGLRKRGGKHAPFSVGLFNSAGFVIGAEATDIINVGIQLRGDNGADIAQCGACQYYLSDNADGSTLAATAPSGGIAIGTDGLMLEPITNKAGLLVSESDGDIDINITEAGVATWYLVLVMPDGSLVISGAITFA